MVSSCSPDLLSQNLGGNQTSDVSIPCAYILRNPDQSKTGYMIRRAQCKIIIIKSLFIINLKFGVYVKYVIN